MKVLNKHIRCYFRFLLSIVLILTINLLVLSGCDSTKNESQQIDTKESVKKDKDYLYDWLLNNGSLENNTELVYNDGAFTLNSDYSKNMSIIYKIPDCDGYEVTVVLPLYDDSKKVATEIRVYNDDSSSSLTYYHNSKTFTRNSPIKYGSIDSFPSYETISMDEYGEIIEENGKYVFHLDENKRDEYEKLKKENEEISSQQTVRENIAKEKSHEALCIVLDWANERLCPLVDIKISDLGYSVYK